MKDFRKSSFRGSLYDLITRELLVFIPQRSAVLNLHLWLVTQARMRNGPLPVRKFSLRGHRGKIYGADSVEFCPVDNEPLAFLYYQALASPEAALPAHMGAALRAGHIPLSFTIATQAQADWPLARRGLVRTVHRDQGLILAHILDAARGLEGDDTKTSLRRFMRSMSPLNVFPWPSPKHVQQKVIWSPNEFRADRADLSGEAWIQEILFAHLLRHLNFGADSSIVREFLSECGAGPDFAARIEQKIQLSREVFIELKPISTPTIVQPTQLRLGQRRLLALPAGPTQQQRTFTAAINRNNNLSWKDFGIAYCGKDGRETFNLRIQTPAGSFVIREVSLRELGDIDPSGEDMLANTYHIPAFMRFEMTDGHASLIAFNRERIAAKIVEASYTPRLVSHLAREVRFVNELGRSECLLPTSHLHRQMQRKDEDNGHP